MMHIETSRMSLINRILMILVLLTVVSNPTSAQRYANTPKDTIDVAGMMEDLATLSFQQLNISSDTISLQWEKISEQIPEFWDASVCDNVICYAGLVSSGKMNPVAPADSGFLLLHITPHVNYGTAIVRYAIWDTSNPASKDTLTYILSVSNTTGIHAINTIIDFSIFPNPTMDNISIITSYPAFTFSINDINGNEIMRGISEFRSTAISTKELPCGYYIITIFAQGKYSARKILKQ